MLMYILKLTIGILAISYIRLFFALASYLVRHIVLIFSNFKCAIFKNIFRRFSLILMFSYDSRVEIVGRFL